jgi:hypothetical protein
MIKALLSLLLLLFSLLLLAYYKREKNIIMGGLGFVKYLVTVELLGSPDSLVVIIFGCRPNDPSSILGQDVFYDHKYSNNSSLNDR